MIDTWCSIDPKSVIRYHSLGCHFQKFAYSLASFQHLVSEERHQDIAQDLRHNPTKNWSSDVLALNGPSVINV